MKIQRPTERSTGRPHGPREKTFENTMVHGTVQGTVLDTRVDATRAIVSGLLSGTPRLPSCLSGSRLMEFILPAGLECTTPGSMATTQHNLSPASPNSMLIRAIFTPSGRIPIAERFQHCTGGSGGCTPQNLLDKSKWCRSKIQAIFIPPTVMAGLVDGGRKEEYMESGYHMFRGPLYV